MQAAIEPGTVLEGRYRIRAPLAGSGRGSVWRAEHVALNFDVVIEMFEPSQMRGLERFLREARALAALSCPYIVTVMDFGSQGELAYLVTELLEGRTLEQRLKAEGKLSAAETERILRDVCKALSHAHERGIIHRDLKPENIFLCDQSREHVTKVLNFCIAKPTGAAASSLLDVWALGAIAYECLRGERLFSGASTADLAAHSCSEGLPLGADVEELPTDFRGWLEKAMHRDPAQRFQSVAELFAALEPVLDAAAADAVRGVNSAEMDRLAPPRAVGLVSSSNSSFARASRTESVPPARGRKRAPIAVVVGSVVAASAVVAALIPNRAPSTAQSAAEPRGARAAALRPPRERPRDAGASPTPRALVKRTPLPETP
jgi:serine/threonine protein kinase